MLNIPPSLLLAKRFPLLCKERSGEVVLIFNFQFSIIMSTYFLTGMFFTLSFNTFLSQMADSLIAGTVSLLGGVLSSVIVAWLKHQWDKRGN